MRLKSTYEFMHFLVPINLIGLSRAQAAGEKKGIMASSKIRQINNPRNDVGKKRQTNTRRNDVGKKRQAIYAAGVEQIKMAIAQDYALEAVTLCESLIADRLEARWA